MASTRRSEAVGVNVSTSMRMASQARAVGTARTVEEHALPAVAFGQGGVQLLAAQLALRHPQREARQPVRQIRTGVERVVDEELPDHGGRNCTLAGRPLPTRAAVGAK